MNGEEMLVNDISSELTGLYKSIQDEDETFFLACNRIIEVWDNASDFFTSCPELISLYRNFTTSDTDKNSLTYAVNAFVDEKAESIEKILGNFPLQNSTLLKNNLQAAISGKMPRMKTLERRKGQLSPEDLNGNIETAIKSAVYTYFRSLYNNGELMKNNPAIHTALFFFLRNYAYSGMFRYNARGKFNVPYGGMSYNAKNLRGKLDYYHSSPLQQHLQRTRIFNEDFAQFLTENRPDENDFIFLDPPYDSEFSTYAKNEFTKNDQTRLADYLIRQCRAKWMLIIKDTPFIYGLYNNGNTNIRAFSKQYTVSFMNRNKKDTTHLLITNY